MVGAKVVGTENALLVVPGFPKTEEIPNNGVDE
jgi:hypothetical protein